MKLAIMQPYLFPYLGYFHLIRAAHAFVVYDDVNYIKGGWINRNFILGKDKRQRITLPLQGASSNRLINQIEVSMKRKKMLESIRQNYSKAPQFNNVFTLIEEIVMHQEKNLASFLDYGLRRICSHLGLYPEWHISSSLQKNNALQGQAKVFAICEALRANHYINLSGGSALYDNESFKRKGIQLSFIQSREVTYRQFKKEFIPNLSIIDVMMFNDQKQCCKLLGEFELLLPAKA